MSPPRMRSNAVGGGGGYNSLAWEGAIMMPLQYTALQMFLRIRGKALGERRFPLIWNPEILSCTESYSTLHQFSFFFSQC
jgi:hypothetical protein